MDWLASNARLRLGDKSRLRKVELSGTHPLSRSRRGDNERRSAQISEEPTDGKGQGDRGPCPEGNEQRPVMKDDALLISSLKLSGKILLFRVKETEPRGVVIVRPETRIDIYNRERTLNPMNSKNSTSLKNASKSWTRLISEDMSLAEEAPAHDYWNDFETRTPGFESKEKGTH